MTQKQKRSRITNPTRCSSSSAARHSARRLLFTQSHLFKPALPSNAPGATLFVVRMTQSQRPETSSPSDGSGSGPRTVGLCWRVLLHYFLFVKDTLRPAQFAHMLWCAVLAPLRRTPAAQERLQSLHSRPLRVLYCLHVCPLALWPPHAAQQIPPPRRPVPVADVQPLDKELFTGPSHRPTPGVSLADSG